MNCDSNQMPAPRFRPLRSLLLCSLVPSLLCSFLAACSERPETTGASAPPRKAEAPSEQTAAKACPAEQAAQPKEALTVLRPNRERAGLIFVSDDTIHGLVFNKEKKLEADLQLREIGKQSKRFTVLERGEGKAAVRPTRAGFDIVPPQGPVLRLTVSKSGSKAKLVVIERGGGTKKKTDKATAPPSFLMNKNKSGSRLLVRHLNNKERLGIVRFQRAANRFAAVTGKDLTYRIPGELPVQFAHGAFLLPLAYDQRLMLAMELYRRGL